MQEQTSPQPNQGKETRPRLRFCDSREPWTICEKLIETGWERKFLPVDYMFWTHDFEMAGITRKTITDLLNSISKPKTEEGRHKGKVFAQHLEEMLEMEFKLKIIILEGSWTIVKQTGSIISGRGIEYFTWDMVWNYLRTWQDKGFTLELTSNEGHTIKRLNSIYAYYQQPYHTGGAPFRHTGDDRIMAFPSGCRGKTAEKVLGTFGSLQEVANREIAELIQVEGIGQKKALAIFEHFRKDGNKKVESVKQEKLL